MTMLKIAILLLVVFTAMALESSREINSDRELPHPYSSPAPSPSANVDGHNKASIFCDIQCALTCHGSKPWEKVSCLARCLAVCTGFSDSFSETDCVVDCVQLSTNNFRCDPNMMDDRIRACTQHCKKD